MAAMSEAKKKANKKWNDANLKTKYDRIQLVLPAGEKAIITDYAKRCGLSVNAFIREAIIETMERDNDHAIPELTDEEKLFSERLRQKMNDQQDADK